MLCDFIATYWDMFCECQIQNNLPRLFTLQNTILRLIYYVTPRQNCKPLYKPSGILPFGELVTDLLDVLCIGSALVNYIHTILYKKKSKPYAHQNIYSKTYSTYHCFTMVYDSYFRFDDDNIKFKYSHNHQKRNGKAKTHCLTYCIKMIEKIA